MKRFFDQKQFSRATLTGVFVGFITTLICLIYNIIYRDSTGFAPQDFINVSTLIFAVNLLFFVIGMLYSVFIQSFRRKGDIIFTIVFVLLTLFCIWQTEVGHRFASAQLNTEFHGLLVGILIISGVAAAFAIPYLFHSKSFEQNVV